MIFVLNIAIDLETYEVLSFEWQLLLAKSRRRSLVGICLFFFSRELKRTEIIIAVKENHIEMLGMIKSYSFA